MISFIDKFKIPTLLGLAIIISGIAAGVFLVLKDQTFFTKASPNLAPQNVTLTNIEDTQLTISWQTTAPITSFVTFGQAFPNLTTVLDDRDLNVPKSHSTHYVTIKSLQPQTSYQFKIVSGKISSDVFKVTTAAPATTQSGLRPIIGSVLDNNQPLEDGIAYLSLSGAVVQSALVKNLGNFLIPLSLTRKADLSDVYQPSEDEMTKITIISDYGEASAIFKLQSSGKLLPPLKLGQNVDLTSLDISTTVANPTREELKKFDLNNDGSINVNDYAILLQNFGPLRSEASKSPKNKATDLNSDGVVDQKDLDLMAKKINQ